MKVFTTAAALTALISLVSGATLERRVVSNANTPPVTVKGNAFFANGKRFYIRGVDYQPGGASANEDPIADASGCKRDIAEFKRLGINTIRIYSVDNSANHDECMKALADAGIYLALDVNTPYYSLNRLNSQAVLQSYNDVYLQSVFATVEMFAQYDNTLLFYSANEVINDNLTTFAAPYVKAVTRDIKAYLSSRNLRKVPVGYSAADINENRYQTATYMNCGSDNVRSDFFAFNDYSWCDPSSYQQSGWNQKVAQYSNYSIPLFLSEFGCNTNTRQFNEIASLYSSTMTPVYSGGLVYEYSQEPSNYGLVTIDGNTVTERADFQALKTAYANTPNPSGDGGYNANGSPSQCPPASDIWNVTTTDLPAMPAGAQKYLSNGAGTGPGNKGTTGSQTSGTPSTGFSSSSGTTSSSGGSSSSTSRAAAVANVRVPELSVVSVVVGGILAMSALLGGSTLLI